MEQGNVDILSYREWADLVALNPTASVLEVDIIVIPAFRKKLYRLF